MNRAIDIINKPQWLLAAPVLLGVMIVVFINAVDPVTAGPLGVLALFAMLYVFSVLLSFGVLRVLVGAYARLISREKTAISNNKAYYIASVLAFVPVLLLAIRSLGQLRLLDVVLVVVLITIAVFYVNRRS